jgi:glutaredoxin-related protein
MQGDAPQVGVNGMAVNSAVRVHTHYRLLDVKTHGQSRHHAWLVQMRDKVGEVEDFKATDFMVVPSIIVDQKSMFTTSHYRGTVGQDDRIQNIFVSEISNI